MADQRQTLTIRYATSVDRERLTDFRICQFKTANEFLLLIPEMLSQQRGHIYIVEHEGEIVSTMQVEYCLSIETFQHLSGSLCLKNKPQENIFPLLYLSKAGTVKPLRNSGINSFLRLLTLRNAIQREEIKALTGIAFENAPRLHLLEKIGYRFTEISMSKDDYTMPLGKTYFLSLQRELFFQAIQKLEVETMELQQAFNIEIEVVKQTA